MEILGVPIAIWHALIVEEPSGISVFIILALAVRVLVDIASHGRAATPRVEMVRAVSDHVAYAGSAATAFFLLLSGITGFLIQPYSAIVAQPILVNISLLALGALFFWSAFFVLRYLSGPEMWEDRPVYLLGLVTAFLGLLFDALAASIGAELSLGESALEPVYSALGFSWRTFTIQPLEIEITLALVIVGMVVAVIALFRAEIFSRSRRPST